MASTRLTQTSFSRGELTPALYKRTDIKQYSLGSKLILNGFIHQEGCLSNRSGLEFVGEVKDSSSNTRLIPFQFNSEETYVIEAGDCYFRFIQDGGYIVDDNGDIYEIETPYSADDLQELKYVQSADVMTLTHLNYAPRELIRYDHDDWELSEITFEPGISAPTGVKVTWTGSTSSNTRTYTYLVTAVQEDTLDESDRSSTVSATGHREAYWTTDEYFTISWTAVSGACEYNIYRSVNGVYGYVGTSETTSFTDDNIEPDLTSCAPIAQNPFEDDNNPSCATYFQQRKVYANTVNNPQTIYASQSATSNNFNISRPLIATDAITIALADREVNEIRHLLGLNDLIALTSNTEYKLNGSDGVFEANPAPVAQVQSSYGASHVQPVISGNMVIFVQAGGSVMRDLGYDYLSDSYTGIELSLFASHLFEGKQVIYMAYAKEPYRLIWVIFNDGSCACLTYNKTQEICGWAREVTDGYFRSVATVREGLEDIAYFVIERYINPVYEGSFTLKEISTRDIEDDTTKDADLGDEVEVVDPLAGDEDTSDDEENTSGDDEETEYSEMLYVYTCGDNTYYSQKAFAQGVEVFTDRSLSSSIGSVNTIIDFIEKPNNYTAPCDTCYVCIGGTKKLYVERMKSRIIDTVQEGFFVDSGLSGTFEDEVTSISGLSHLAGKKVIAVSDGGVIENLTVSSDGKITLPYAVTNITVGLPFLFKFESLNIEGEATHGLKKMINNVSVSIKDSREEFLAGGNTGSYMQMNRSLDSVNDANELFSVDVDTTPFNVPSPDSTIIIAQHKPLPLTILSASATFTVEDISDTQ